MANGSATRRPLIARPATRNIVIAALIVWVLIMLALGNTLYVIDRFEHHSQVVDARIEKTTKSGCISASGGGSVFGNGGENVYRVEFPHDGRTVRTTVSKPCDVIPPDYGRGRGSIWIEFDVDDPDRNRVLTDHKINDTLTSISVILALYIVVVGFLGFRILRR